MLMTDGPFVDSKEFLAGLILVEAENLDGALAVAAELQELDVTAAIEVRPVLEQELGVLEDVFRDQWGRVLATLVGVLGDIELAEDAAQESFALAAERWPRDGQPVNPTGWLIATARNRAVDRIRRERTLAIKTERLKRELREGSEETMDETTTFPGRAARADLHLLPSGARARRAGRTDAAHARRPLDRGDRTRLPRSVRDDEQAPDPRQAQDPGRRHTVCRPARPPAARAARRRARRDLALRRRRGCLRSTLPATSPAVPRPRGATGTCWPLPDREPHLLETVRPGVFTAGDVRSGASKRVAGAVGDGALAVRFAHEVLAG